jgi:hypothetical protein
MRKILVKQTIIYRLISLFNDKTFYYLIDTLPSYLTNPND